MKETFILRTEWSDAILEMEPLDQASIFQNLFHFHNGNEELIILNNLSVKLVWKMILPNLIRNAENYDRRCETSVENGKKGGRPKGAKNADKNQTETYFNQKIPNGETTETKKPIESLNDYDYDIDYDNDNDIDLKNNSSEQVGFLESKVEEPVLMAQKTEKEKSWRQKKKKRIKLPCWMLCRKMRPYILNLKCGWKCG